MEITGSPKRNKMEEIGERVLASHMRDESKSTSNFLQSNDPQNSLLQSVVGLSRLLKSSKGNVSNQQMEKIRLYVNQISHLLNQIGKTPTPEIGENNLLFESYKVLSCALLLLQNNQYSLFQSRSLPSNQSNSFQLSQIKTEINSIETQFNEYRKSSNKIFKLVRDYFQISNATSLDDLYLELQQKIQNNNFMKAYSMQFPTNTSQMKNFSISLKDKQINSMIAENQLLQNRVNDLTIQNSSLRNQIENVHSIENDKSEVILLQTDLSQSKMNLEASTRKIEHLKGKLNKTRNELSVCTDNAENYKRKLEETEMELQEMRLEKEAASSIPTQSTLIQPIENSVDIEKFNTALDKIGEQLQNQSKEVAQVQKIKDNLISCVQKQNSVITIILNKAKEMETKVKLLEIEKNDITKSRNEQINENKKLKQFVSGVGQILSANANNDNQQEITKIIESLDLDVFRDLFYRIVNVKKVDGSMVDRLFSYLESQIEIINSLAEQSNQTAKSNILQSITKCEQFIKENRKSDFPIRSPLFDSLGVVVDENKFSLSVENLLKKFRRNTNGRLLIDNYDELESHELFDIALQAIAMNSLLRSIANDCKEQSAKDQDILSSQSEKFKKVAKALGKAKNELEIMKSQFRNEIEKSKIQIIKFGMIKQSLKIMIEKGCLKLPTRLQKAIETNHSMKSPLSEDEIEAFHKSQTDFIASIENCQKEKQELSDQLNAEKEINQNLMNQNETIQKDLEIIQQREKENSLKLNADIKSFSNAKSELQNERNELIAIHKIEIEKLKNDFNRHLADLQKNSEIETNQCIQKVYADYQRELKSTKNQLKEKLKKAENLAKSQTDRADSLKDNYERLLQASRDRLKQSKEEESEVRQQLEQAVKENISIKAQLSKLQIENKMLNIQLLSSQSNEDENSQTKFTQLMNQDSKTIVKQNSVISQLEEKIEKKEKETLEFCIHIKELFREYITSGQNFLSFETIREILNRASCDIIEIKDENRRLKESENELDRIKAVIKVQPGVSISHTVSMTIESMTKEIQKFRNQNSDF